MNQLSHSEHVTALFAIALYYWYTGDDLNAQAVMAVANMAAQLKTPMYA